jgi:endonuclease YncB( thermonuclease family)
MNRIVVSVIFPACLVITSVVDVSAASYRVTKVVDGDTIVVRIGKKDEVVRLVGIDAPELSSSAKTKKGCYAVQARDFLNRKLVGNMLYFLKIDCQGIRIITEDCLGMYI